jgi:hypothetical protein
VAPLGDANEKRIRKFSLVNMAALPNVRAKQDVPPKGGYPEVSTMGADYAILIDIGRVLVDCTGMLFLICTYTQHN